MWRLNVLVAIPGNMQNGSSQVMGAVRASLLQEDRYKTWMSNLIERQDHRLKVCPDSTHGAKNVSCIKRR